MHARTHARMVAPVSQAFLRDGAWLGVDAKGYAQYAVYCTVCMAQRAVRCRRNTALHLAACKGHAAVVKTLLARVGPARPSK
jgi:hypothetical protein